MLFYNIYGVPQGSALGPILFNIYINDIPQLASTNIAIFADDAAIFAFNRNYKYAIIAINKHMNLIVSWLKNWRIKLNTDKGEAALFTTKHPRTYNNYIEREHTYPLV